MRIRVFWSKRETHRGWKSLFGRAHLRSQNALSLVTSVWCVVCSVVACHRPVLGKVSMHQILYHRLTITSEVGYLLGWFDVGQSESGHSVVAEPIDMEVTITSVEQQARIAKGGRCEGSMFARRLDSSPTAGAKCMTDNGSRFK